MTPSPFFIVICQLCLVAMFVTTAMCLYRIVIGPKAADRAVALDLLTIAFIGIVCLLCIMWGTSWYFDAIWILTLVGFLGTAAIARYLEKGKVF
jgi:multisubunit Na+/H+ antiporter MnhF subunit